MAGARYFANLPSRIHAKLTKIMASKKSTNWQFLTKSATKKTWTKPTTRRK
jgi:hypothetical protein